MNRQSDRLPQGWKWVRLGDVCEVILGQSPPSSTYRKIPEGLPFFQGKADFGDISPNPTTWCVEPKKVAEAGDVLISMRAPVGPTNIANARCCIGRGLAAIRCRNEADRDFVLAGLKLYESDISSMGTGSLFNAITGKQLKEFVFPLPPLSEQKRIADLLNQQMAYVEKARKAAEEMLEAAQALPGAFLRQVFPAHGDALPAGWKWTKLGDVCKIVSGSTPKTNVTAYWNGTITWITPTDMGKLTTKYISSSQRAITQTGYASCSTKLIPAGAVIMSTRAPIGHLGIASVPLCTSQGCKTFVPGADVDTEFLYFSLLTHIEDIQALGSGSTFQEVSKTKLSKFEICLPPLTEQKRIAALLNQQMAYVETVRMSAREQLDAINALPAALLRRAFAGTL